MKLKTTTILLALTCLTIGTVALAADTNPTTIGGVAEQATKSISGIARLITSAAYVAGLAFVVGAIVKFKAHKDNPTQIPIGTPIAMLFVGAALIFSPTVFEVAGTTLFGSSAKTGSVEGMTDFGTGGSSGGNT